MTNSTSQLFLYNRPIFNGHHRLRRAPTVLVIWKLLKPDFYRSNSLPSAKPTSTKSSSEWKEINRTYSYTCGAGRRFSSWGVRWWCGSAYRGLLSASTTCCTTWSATWSTMWSTMCRCRASAVSPVPLLPLTLSTAIHLGRWQVEVK